MAAYSGAQLTPLTWSTCTVAYINPTLASPSSSCLNNVPSAYPTLPSPCDTYPGLCYSADDQCQIQAGTASCPLQSVICQQYCRSGTSGCRGSSFPKLEGTMCGTDKWCIQGECVDMTTVPQVTAPIVTPASGSFGVGGSVVVKMSNVMADVQIRYTLDGTTPSANSTLYTEPFTVSRTTEGAHFLVYPLL